jgi:glycosyltransferase involved in cell wall biosynthesis
MAQVSVVIPTHNRPDRLANAIRSVLDQTYTDFELFVVDDGSADDAAADTVRACGDSRVGYVRLPVSRGPAAARNAGIARSTAPYVALLDDDDEWLPAKLKIQLAALERAEPRVGMSYTARITIDRISGTETVTRFPAPFDRASGLNVITLSSVVMRRSCFERVGVFDEELFGNEDFDLWIRLAQSVDFEYIDEPLVRYFVHVGGISQQEQPRALSFTVLERNIRSLERLLAKHRYVFERNRRQYCLSYLALAERYRDIGDTRNQRRTLRHALRLWPLEPRTYLAFVRSHWGALRADTPAPRVMTGRPRDSHRCR